MSGNDSKASSEDNEQKANGSSTPDPRGGIDYRMKRIAVTGGGGFVGKAIVRLAAARGIECRVIGRHRYAEVEALGATCLVGDIRDRQFLRAACRDVDTVFHVAALAGIWGKWRDYYSINVEGTEHVLAACRENGVGQLVYTSTPSVVFNRRDIRGGDESLPYPESFLCHYARSKVMAERRVLAASGAEMATCAIRPHLVWGPGDPHLVPRLLERGKRRQLKIVGDGTNQVDISYIDNVAHAHLLAGAELAGGGLCAAKAYFVSQGEPVRLWDWINDLFQRVGIEPVSGSVPFALAYSAGALLESWHTILRRETEPRMTRFLAEQLAKSHFFSNARIERDLGYRPLVSTEDGMNSLVDWIRRNEIDLL